MKSEEEIVAVALSAGLASAVEMFRDDVVAAARSARSFREGLGTTADPKAEPWPPMRAAVKP